MRKVRNSLESESDPLFHFYLLGIDEHVVKGTLSGFFGINCQLNRRRMIPMTPTFREILSEPDTSDHLTTFSATSTIDNFWSNDFLDMNLISQAKSPEAVSAGLNNGVSHFPSLQPTIEYQNQNTQR